MEATAGRAAAAMATTFSKRSGRITAAPYEAKRAPVVPDAGSTSNRPWSDLFEGADICARAPRSGSSRQAPGPSGRTRARTARLRGTRRLRERPSRWRQVQAESGKPCRQIASGPSPGPASSRAKSMSPTVTLLFVQISGVGISTVRRVVSGPDPRHGGGVRCESGSSVFVGHAHVPATSISATAVTRLAWPLTPGPVRRSCSTSGPACGRSGSTSKPPVRRENGLHLTAFLSHLHWDHIIGLPFFPTVHHPGTTLDVYGPPQQGGTLHDVFERVLHPRSSP